MDDFKELPFKLEPMKIDAREQSKFPPVVEKGVPQNQHVDTVIPSSDGQVYAIHTNGRIGCDASLLWTTEPNGTEHITMTHYDPNHVDDHLQIITERGKVHPQGQRRGVLLTRCDVNDTWRQQVTEALSEFVGGEIDVIPMPHLGLDEAKELADPLKKLKY